MIYADSYSPAFLTWHRAYLLLFEVIIAPVCPV